MKKLRLLFLSLFIIGLLSGPTLLAAASIGDFQSTGNGDWGSTTTWQNWNGSSWVPASTTPSSLSAAAVTILSGHTVTISVSVSIRNVTINLGGKVAITGTATTGLLTVTDEGMTVNGSLDINGTSPSAAPYTVTMTTPAVLTIGSTGVVNYNQGGTTNALPIATWSTGSTLNVTGIVSATSFKAGGAQKFYNVNWTCPSQTGNFGWSFKTGSDSVIYGTVTISNTGASSRVQFFATNSGHLRIMGNLNVTGTAAVAISGTSSTSIIDTISIYGNVNANLTTGNFSLSRGSGANINIWNFYGDVTVTGGTMQNSNPTTDSCKFVFKKPGTQNLTLSPTSLSGSNPIPIEVASGTTLTLLSPVHVSTLFLSGGVIVSSIPDTLVMGYTNGTTVSLGGGVRTTVPGSYVNGPMAYLYATAGGTTTKDYPIGKGGTYRSISLSLTQTDATPSTYTAELFNAAPPSNTLSGSLTNVSTVRYFKVSEGSGGSGFTAGTVKIGYDIGDGVNNATNLRVAQGPSAGGGSWVDLGGTGSASPTGTITSTNPFASLTNTIFTLGNVSNGCTLNLTALLEAMYVSGGSSMPNPVDVTVELHDASTLAIVESRTATLSTAGVGSFLFTTVTNGTPYYIVVKSPTTVEAWSAAAHSFTSGALSYDFTSGVGQAYTDGSMDPMGIHGGKACIYSGDVNQDGQVTSDDFTGVDNDNANFDYHIQNDVNGDGQVTSDDFTWIDNNNSNFVARQVPPGAPSHLVNRSVKNHPLQIKSSVK
ncbi:MAG: dockerin type I repeat-containing protein [Ignavibacteriaceae bacterium]|nr:dockerin type I repeat-containing protein [Ignavibacteriaceae bacterium]